ncbi:MAG: peptidoglycan DD-metalloendopeptidase family protein [Pseudonocardiaceae bacterium]|nr:peptidoglycan DD-metalloendopeptidase family protein [Pseudonocardiaceae bacterium]
MSTAARRAGPLLVIACVLLTGSERVPDVRPAATDVAAPAGTFSWPLAPPHPVLRRFERPATPYGPGHRGVDLGGSRATEVLAAGAGVVIFAGPLAGRGVVSVEHAGGLRTTYEPVTATVRRGQRVRRGEVIGRLAVGHPECAAAACLHWGVRRGEEYLDPLRLVAAGGRVRLLPWHERGG